MWVFCSFLFQVTVFQTVKNPGRPDRFTFTVDGLLRNMTVYITGSRTLTFRVTSPTGAVIFPSVSSHALKNIVIFTRAVDVVSKELCFFLHDFRCISELLSAQWSSGIFNDSRKPFSFTPQRWQSSRIMANQCQLVSVVFHQGHRSVIWKRLCLLVVYCSSCKW